MPNVLCVTIDYNLVDVPEHHGHYDELGNPIHPSNIINGTFSLGTSKCKVSGVNVLVNGDKSTELCSDVDGEGIMISLPCKCKVNGKYIAISGSSALSHAGISKELVGGNGKLKVGGM